MNNVLESSIAWNGETIKARQKTHYVLSQADIEELQAATNIAQANRKNLIHLNIVDFPLLNLSNQLNNFADELENGSGVIKITGFPVEKFTFLETQVIFWGLGIHIGTSVSQSNNREYIMDVKDLGGTVGDGKARGATTKIGLGFHSDPCDAIAFSCWRQAQQGGYTHLASAAAAYDYILQHRPDLLETLLKPFTYTRPDWDQQGKNKKTECSVFSLQQGKLVCNYLRGFIENNYSPTRKPNILSALQTEALDYLDATLEKLAWRFLLVPGEMLFVNNFLVLHARSAFEDYSEEKAKRLLIRLWLAMANSRELPDTYQLVYGSTKAGALRGSIY